MPIPRNRRRQINPRATATVTKDSPTGFYNKDGSPVASIAKAKVGDVLFKHQGGKLVEVSVKSVKPFEVQGHIPGHGIKATHR